jgi:hypothetical protein
LEPAGPIWHRRPCPNTVQASSWILAVVVEKIDNLSERAYRSTVPHDDARKDREKQRQGNGEPA